MNQEKVYALKEIELLDSGERGFYVNLYKTEQAAINAMERDIGQHKENNDAKISYGQIGDWHVELTDSEKNRYEFRIEALFVEE